MKHLSATISCISLFATLTAAACAKENANFEDPEPAECDSSDTFDWDGVEYAEAESFESIKFCDPEISGRLHTAPAEKVVVTARYGQEIDYTYSNQLTFSLHSDGTNTSPHIINGSGAAGSAEVAWSSAGGTQTCEVTSGSVSVTRFDQVGGKIEGMYNLDSFATGDGATCPSGAVVGTFSANRIKDYEQ